MNNLWPVRPDYAQPGVASKKVKTDRLSQHVFMGVGLVVWAVVCGEGGFGYDPLFLPEEFPGRSMADLTMNEKNTISHRGRALQQLKRWLMDDTKV